MNMDETLDLTLLCEQCDKHSCVCEDWIMKNDIPQEKIYSRLTDQHIIVELPYTRQTEIHSDGRGGLYEMSTGLYLVAND